MASFFIFKNYSKLWSFDWLWIWTWKSPFNTSQKETKCSFVESKACQFIQGIFVTVSFHVIVTMFRISFIWKASLFQANFKTRCCNILSTGPSLSVPLFFFCTLRLKKRFSESEVVSWIPIEKSFQLQITGSRILGLSLLCNYVSLRSQVVDR